MLQLRALTIAFDGQAPLIEGLDVSVPSGELHLLQGPSGCGKSTLLGVISGAGNAVVRWTGGKSVTYVGAAELIEFAVTWANGEDPPVYVPSARATRNDDKVTQVK